MSKRPPTRPVKPHASGGGDIYRHPTDMTAYRCENCGHRWRNPAAAEPCPACGRYLGVRIDMALATPTGETRA